MTPLIGFGKLVGRCARLVPAIVGALVTMTAATSLAQTQIVYGWGYASDGAGADTNVPIQVMGLGGATAVDAGGNHNLALKAGAVWSWGQNDKGQLGDGTTLTRLSPVQVLSISTATKIAAGQDFSLALLANGTVVSWGGNGFGQLGNGTATASSTPVQVSGLTNVVSIAAGDFHALAIKNDGTIWTWGYNAYGQLGNGTMDNSSTPVQVLGLLSTPVQVAGGSTHSAVRFSNGQVWCWGNNENGQLGDGMSPAPSLTPVQATGVSNVTQIAVGKNHTVVVQSNGTVWSWGTNASGELGNGTTNEAASPVQVSGLTTAVAVGAGGSFSLAALADGTARSWGSNAQGQLGNGNNTSSLVPVTVSGLTYVEAVSGGAQHGLALTVPPAPPKLQGVSISPNVVYGPGETTGTVTLDNPALAGGYVVDLSADYGVTMPASVTVSEGSTTANFTIGVQAVPSRQRVNITASAEGLSFVVDMYINSPFVTAVAINPEVVYGGQSTVGTVTINSQAPTGGFVVNLSSDNSSRASVPSTVTVAAGQTSADFAITSYPGLEEQLRVLITASAGGASKAKYVYVNRAILQSLSFGPNVVFAGTNTTGAVSLNVPAPVGGVVVALSTNNAVISIPPTVTINAGETFALFTVTPSMPAGGQETAVVTAVSNGVTKQAAVYVNRPFLTGLSLSPQLVYGGQSSTGTVTINSAAPAGGFVVGLSSANPGRASLPASVTILEGETSATFTITTTPGLTPQIKPIISATADGVTKQVALYINRPFITGLSFSPLVVVGGASSTGTVTLNAPAPNSFTVTLSSDNGAATVPASVTFEAGATTATFTVTTSPVVGPQVKAIITASRDGVSKRAAVYINASGLMALRDRDRNPLTANAWPFVLTGLIGLAADVRRRTWA